MMNWENQSLVTVNQRSLKNNQFKIQDIKKITDMFRGMYRRLLNLIKDNRKDVDM